MANQLFFRKKSPSIFRRPTVMRIENMCMFPFLTVYVRHSLKRCLELCPLRELKDSVHKKVNGTSPGMNGLSYVPYKKCHSIMLMVHKVVRNIWTTEVIPKDWITAFVVLLSKSDVLDDPSEFRPIAITNTVGEIFFSVISDRLQKFLVSNNYRSSYSEGFSL